MVKTLFLSLTVRPTEWVFITAQANPLRSLFQELNKINLHLIINCPTNLVRPITRLDPKHIPIYKWRILPQLNWMFAMVTKLILAWKLLSFEIYNPELQYPTLTQSLIVVRSIRSRLSRAWMPDRPEFGTSDGSDFQH